METPKVWHIEKIISKNHDKYHFKNKKDNQKLNDKLSQCKS